jgi:D-amino-acid oxidase
MNPDALVIGAGVCGLSAAIALLDAGLSVTVYASEPPQRTTSAVAGALWGPHLVGEDERIARWAGQTLEWFRELVAEPSAGVREIAGLVATSAADVSDPPPFTLGAGTLTSCQSGDLPGGYRAGWRYTAPVVEMPAYLEYLLESLLRKGGQLHLGQPLRDITDAGPTSRIPVVVNCTGMGARELVPDASLAAVRGQVVTVANPGVTGFFVGEGEDIEEVTYFFPHGSTVLLGGTHQDGVMTRQPDAATAERILARCAAVEPRLAGATVLAHRAGLRPVRPSVRLEVEAIGGGRHVVHNYGHGGAGVTLSWGCALEVAGLVTALRG